MKKADDQLIYDLNFPPHNPLYLYQLAITALIVHQVNTSYFLVTNNCYHYAGAIMKLLEIQYNIANSASGANAGKWCGLDIYQDQDPERNLASLVERVSKAIKEFVSLHTYQLLNFYLCFFGIGVSEE